MSRKEPFGVFDHFNHKSGSDVWPSDNPNDSPYDTFTCRHCGRSTELRMYGSFGLGEDPWKEAKDFLREHLLICPKFVKY